MKTARDLISRLSRKIKIKYSHFYATFFAILIVILFFDKSLEPECKLFLMTFLAFAQGYFTCK